MSGSTSFHFPTFSFHLDPATNLIKRGGKGFSALIVEAIVDTTIDLAKLGQSKLKLSDFSDF